MELKKIISYHLFNFEWTFVCNFNCNFLYNLYSRVTSKSSQFWAAMQLPQSGLCTRGYFGPRKRGLDHLHCPCDPEKLENTTLFISPACMSNRPLGRFSSNKIITDPPISLWLLTVNMCCYILLFIFSAYVLCDMQCAVVAVQCQWGIVCCLEMFWFVLIM